MPRISFGDTVRVLSTPITESIGLAGIEGTVYGHSKPSASGVTPVIGDDKNDYAINVYFEELKLSHWFVEELLEFVDLNAGMEFRLDGVSTRFVKTDKGDWVERDIEEKPSIFELIRRMFG